MAGCAFSYFVQSVCYDFLPWYINNFIVNFIFLVIRCVKLFCLHFSFSLHDLYILVYALHPYIWEVLFS